MTTLIQRCQQTHDDATNWQHLASPVGMRAVLEHLAAELVHAGHHSAAAWLLSQLQAEVIPLRPTPGDAA